MGISPKNGSLKVNPVKAPNVNVFHSTLDREPRPEEQMIDKEYVKNNLMNRTAVNIDRETGPLMALEKYISGTDIVVTYYHHMDANTTDQSTQSDTVDSLDPVHNSMMRINNFRLKLQSEISYSYSEDDNTSTVTGEALVYSNFNPKAGDWFLYEIDKGVLARFVIDGAPTRLSVSNTTCRNVVFRMSNIVNKQDIAEYEQRVRQVLWFDKDMYFSNEGTLLRTDEYKTIQELEHIYDNLWDMWYNEYYDNNYKSFLRPDGIYDPYIVEFVKRHFSLRNSTNTASQLLNKFPDYDKSIWYKIEHPDRIRLSKALHHYTTETKSYDADDVTINYLINNTYLVMEEESDDATCHPYIVEDIYGLGAVHQGPFEQVLYSYLNSGTVYIPCMSRIYLNRDSWTPLERMYNTIIYLYLVKQAISILQQGMLYTPVALDKLLPFSMQVTPNDLWGKVKLYGIEDIYYLERMDGTEYNVVKYCEYYIDSVVFDFLKFMEDNDIRDYTNPWKVVTNTFVSEMEVIDV